MKKNVLVAIFMASLVLGVAFGQQDGLPLLIGAESARELLAQGTIKWVQLKSPQQALLPRDSLGSEIRTQIEAFAPSLMVEALYLYKKPASGADKLWNESERLAVFNAIRSLSTLSGIEYYSASRKKMRIFYEKSFAIANPEKTDPLPDPLVSSLPSKSTIYVLQKDLTFGENIYQYDYTTSGEALSFTQTNLTDMDYGVITIFGKGRLKTVVYVTDVGDSLLLYAVSAGKATLLPGIEGKVRDSFSNRADAIFKWFVGQMTPIFGK